MDSFPHFPYPPPPPAHLITPPPPPPVIPPSLPPPPFHPIPPPPHVPRPPFHPITPPPHVPPPPPSPDNGPTVIIVVIISFGCIFFLAFCMFALWCMIKKRKKKTLHETDIIRTDKHVSVTEAIVEGPRGRETLVLSIEEDKHTDKEIFKNEKVDAKHMHAKSGEVTATDLETGESSSNPSMQQTHPPLEHKH